MSLTGKSKAAAGLAAVLTVGPFCGGCGDVYRPVANPILQPGGDPQRMHHVLVVSKNGPCPTGTAMDCGTAVAIDVSGDTAVASFSGVNAVGRNPMHATNLGGTDYVVNRDDNSLSVFTLPVIPNSLNKPAIITLSTGASPVFAASAQGKIFVADSGTNGVAVISGNNYLPPEIKVGANPVALVATPDGTQLYCLNQDDNSISVIFPANNTVLPPIQVGTSPVWGAVSADGTRVFVVNQGSDNVSVIDTSSQTVVNPPLSVRAGPNYIVYDSALNRAYVTSPAGNSLSIIDNKVDPNQCALKPTLCVQTISMASGACNGQHPISVTALADGTRAYVADQASNNVCVLNTASNKFTKAIPVGTAPTTTVGITSDPDSTRVYTASAATLPIASISRSSNVVTVTTSGSNPFAVGQTVVIAGVKDTTYNGSFGITAVGSSTQFTYSQSGADSSSSGGTATVGYVAIIQTSSDTLVMQGDGVTPLTIPTLGTPTFITLTP